MYVPDLKSTRQRSLWVWTWYVQGVGYPTLDSLVRDDPAESDE